MEINTVVYRPIGIIHSPHKDPEQTPIQPMFAAGCRGTAEIFPEYVDGLRDLDGFSHIYLLYHLHLARPGPLLVTPFLQRIERGVFATRSPHRPNPIGLSIVRLERRECNLLYLDGLDMLDGTPLLDIKPYTSRFDCIQSTRDGWIAEIDSTSAERFGRRHITK